MARKKDEYKKAKTCIHGKGLTKLGGLFVKTTCPNDAVIQLPTRDITGNIKITLKRPYILAQKCESCEHYQAKKKITTKKVVKKEIVKKSVKKTKGR